MSVNRVCISGNLTRDPEIRATAGGTAVMTFGVAVNDRRKNAQTGEWEDYPNYIDATMFGTRADALARYLHKGTKVAIEGKLRWSSWEKDGQRRSKIEVIVDEIEFMSPRGQQQPAPMPAPVQQAPVQQAPVQQAPVQQQIPTQPPQWTAQQAYRQPPATTGPQPAYQQVQMPEVYDSDIPF